MPAILSRARVRRKCGGSRSSLLSAPPPRAYPRAPGHRLVPHRRHDVADAPDPILTSAVRDA